MLLRWTIGRNKTEPLYLNALLLLSLIFYAWHIPEYLGILLFSALVDYVAAKQIASLVATDKRRRFWLLASLVTNLGLLATFKYCAFFFRSLENLGLPVYGPANLAHLVLPMGISFYTFQSMSYTIDVYRGKITPCQRFSPFLLYISFFPQLVAGPIVRAGHFLRQLGRARRPRAIVFSQGLYLIIRGFFLKLCLADNLGQLVDDYWGHAAGPQGSTGLTLLVAMLFSAQIFSDFAGYSSIARGVGYWLGFQIPRNFNYPYIAPSFSDFWRRWHISLSEWLRDYLYIPLGGNRSSQLKTFRNILIVMGLGGLWHGAANSFILWGLLHAGGLITERLLGVHTSPFFKRPLPKVCWFVGVQLFVLITWIVFRSGSIRTSLDIVANIAQFQTILMTFSDRFYCALYLVPIIAMHVRAYLFETKVGIPEFKWEKPVYGAVMFYLILIGHGRGGQFIYFQF